MSQDLKLTISVLALHKIVACKKIRISNNIQSRKSSRLSNISSFNRMSRLLLLLAKSRKSRSVTNKSIKQSKKSARGQGAKKKAQSRRAPAGRGRLGGGGPAPHHRKKPTPKRLPSQRSDSWFTRRDSIKRNRQHLKPDELEP